MSCAFDLRHYRELLDAARAGGYRFAGFDRDPEPGDLLLRHDVDLSLEAALEVARLEHAAGATATYFLMTESVFYNLASKAGERALEELRARPPRRAARRLSACRPRRALRPGRRLAQPRSRIHVRAGRRRGERDGAAVLLRPTPTAPTRTSTGATAARTSSSPAGDFDWLQLLTHPEIWAFPGATMRETMEAMLDADRAARLKHLRDDRIDLS